MANTEKGSERSGAGNFAQNPERASEAGKKGGHESHGGTSHEKSAGTGKSGNFADDHQKASDAGKKGGSR